MTDFDEFLRDPKRHLLLQQERLVLDVTEQVCELMAKQGINRTQLARRLGRTRSEITQMLDGSTDMSLAKVAELFFALDYEAHVNAQPLHADRPTTEIQDNGG